MIENQQKIYFPDVRLMSAPETDVEPLDAATGDSWAFAMDKVDVDPVKMLRIHGYRDLEKVRPVIRKTADDIAEKAAELMSPVARAQRIDVVGYDDERLELRDGTVFEEVDFENILNGARTVVAMVITVGQPLDDAVIAAMEVFEPLEALFLETAGWLGVEAATREFVQDLQARVKPEGVRVTRRIGPGYQYQTKGQKVHWPLEQQRRLFDLFDGTELPVTLMESCAMLPKMSRSGIYGLTPVN